MDTTIGLQAGIRAVGDLEIVGSPPMTVFAFGSAERDIFAIADCLEGLGWRIDRQTDPECLHLIVNPIHAQVSAAFLADLAQAYDSAPAFRDRRSSAVVYGVTSHVPAGGDVGETILRHLEMRYDTEE
jgi:sphinganine-1-phosphate aldolase